MAGYRKLFFPTVQVTLGEDIPKAKGLTEFVRCQLTRNGTEYEARSTGTQSSGVLSSLSLGESLVIGPPDTDMLRKGTTATAIVLDREEFMPTELPF